MGGVLYNVLEVFQIQKGNAIMSDYEMLMIVLTIIAIVATALK